MMNLIIKYGKRKYIKINMYEVIADAFDKSKSEVKKMFDQGGITMRFETDREKL